MPQVQDVLKITKPHPKLWTLYVIRALLAFPLAPILLPYLWFRFHTMTYRFDAEGVNMRWGILFRREIQLAYARIQDIHLSSGPIQRYLGLADVEVQTASASASAEMTIEGLLEHELVRDFLYQRMRGLKDHGKPAAPHAEGAAHADERSVALLQEIAAELRGAREALEGSAR